MGTFSLVIGVIFFDSLNLIILKRQALKSLNFNESKLITYLLKLKERNKIFFFKLYFFTINDKYKNFIIKLLRSPT